MSAGEVPDWMDYLGWRPPAPAPSQPPATPSTPQATAGPVSPAQGPGPSNPPSTPTATLDDVRAQATEVMNTLRAIDIFERDGKLKAEQAEKLRNQIMEQASPDVRHMLEYLWITGR